MEKHWTQRSIKDFIYRIAADFISQLEDKMEAEKMSQDKLAGKVNKTKSAVSQILNNPGNMKLETMIEYARALGLKVSIVAYDDKNDPNNDKGPINSEIFKICWEKTGAPRDFWAVAEIGKSTKMVDNAAINALTAPGFVSFNKIEAIDMLKTSNPTILSSFFEEEQPQNQPWEEIYSIMVEGNTALRQYSMPREQIGVQGKKIQVRQLFSTKKHQSPDMQGVSL